MSLALLQLKIVQDWKVALKNKDSKKDVLSLIITELKNRAIKENIPGTDGRVVPDTVAFEVLLKMAKQRKEAMEAYQAAKRFDLVEKEASELKVIEEYLPTPLSEEELESLVKAAIKEASATSMKDMGKVMGLAIKASDGRADGKQLQKIVQNLLQGK